MRRRGLGLFLSGGAVALLLSAWAAMTIGDIETTAGDVAKVLANRLFGATYNVDPVSEGVVWHYRLSRTVVAACAGGALALCGVVLQALLRNPLAEPYLLGISAGASTGAVLVIVLGFGVGGLGLSGGAFFGAAAAFAFVMILARGAGGGVDKVILSGIAGSQLFNAATSFIVTTSASAEQTRGVMFWLLGSLGGVRWPDALLAVPVLVLGVAICLSKARALDAFAFGEDAAASLGVEVMKLRIGLFAVTALLTAAVVSVVGAVGFVGLVVPHAVRFVVGADHERLIPASVLSGAVFLVLADILSRVIVPGQVLPIGVVTALIGAPAFATILWQSRRRS
ncbi:FecCD family ABC transporter permease [Seohaeicola nanhaiensis]|uniref:FecCD family ABC transporter permease n=1 Tax=Seohaeicola nanhaiensis TaxID=1387282 RepID=A0ABV9KC49_9RHOB